MDEVSCDNCDYFPILKNEHDSKGKVHFHSPFTFSGPLDIDSQTRVTGPYTQAECARSILWLRGGCQEIPPGWLDITGVTTCTHHERIHIVHGIKHQMVQLVQKGNY